MKKFLANIFFATLLAAATFPDQENALDIEANYYDGNKSCLLITLHTKLIGTQKEAYGKDIVKFLVYDDGKVIASKEIALPVGVAVERNLTIFYAGNLSSRSPGVAIESEELGLYIDPLHYTSIHQSCTPLLAKQVEKVETKDLCGDLSELGFRCEETSK